ncbi:hypothetical protein LINPERPRIM_LOCUS35801 [Linum perenne]
MRCGVFKVKGKLHQIPLNPQLGIHKHDMILGAMEEDNELPSGELLRDDIFPLAIFVERLDFVVELELARHVGFLGGR